MLRWISSVHGIKVLVPRSLKLIKIMGTLQGTKISHLEKRNNIFKSAFERGHVSSPESSFLSLWDLFMWGWQFLPLLLFEPLCLPPRMPTAQPCVLPPPPRALWPPCHRHCQPAQRMSTWTTTWQVGFGGLQMVLGYPSPHNHGSGK